jgi:hypothetical protein
MRKRFGFSYSFDQWDSYEVFDTTGATLALVPTHLVRGGTSIESLARDLKERFSWGPRVANAVASDLWYIFKEPT